MLVGGLESINLVYKDSWAESKHNWFRPVSKTAHGSKYLEWKSFKVLNFCDQTAKLDLVGGWCKSCFKALLSTAQKYKLESC